MFEQFIEYANHFNAGDLILFLVVTGWVGRQIYIFITRALDKHKSRVEESLGEKQEFQKLVSDLADTKNMIETYKKNFDETIVDFDGKFKENDGDITKVRSEVVQLAKAIETYTRSMTLLEERVGKIEKQVELLFKTDKEQTKTFLIDAYNRYVKKDKTIDLLTLQAIENVYNQYLEETGESDEFFTKLMRELRSLPTTREKKGE